jgi:predicted DNA-binding protein (MmcQ/YjbR family)
MRSNRKSASQCTRAVHMEKEHWLVFVFLCDIPKTKLKYPEKGACR